LHGEILTSLKFYVIATGNGNRFAGMFRAQPALRGREMRQQVSHQDRLFGYDAAELFTMLIGIALLTVLAMIF
jgi:hypothetical protein